MYLSILHLVGLLLLSRNLHGLGSREAGGESNYEHNEIGSDSET